MHNFLNAVFTSGRISTLNRDQPRAGALVVADGALVAAGGTVDDLRHARSSTFLLRPQAHVQHFVAPATTAGAKP